MKNEPTTKAAIVADKLATGAEQLTAKMWNDKMNESNRVNQILNGIESPYMEQRRIIREGHEARQRAIESLFVWKIVAVMGWLAFLAVVIVAGMR